MKKFLVLIASCLLLASCSSEERTHGTEPQEGKTTFTGLFVKRPISLKMLLGSKFTVEDIYTHEQNTYDVHYDKATRVSFITDVQTQDTIWVGFADRGNSLWMLETPISDSTFHASALAIDGDILFGFRQMTAQQLIIDKMVKQGKMDHLFAGGNENGRILSADRILLQPYLESTLSKLEPRFMIISKPKESRGHIKSVVNTAKSDIEGNVSIHFKQAGDYIVEISNNSGAKVSQETSGLVEFKMNAGKAVGPSMMLTITRKTTGEFVEKLKVEVSK